MKDFTLTYTSSALEDIERIFQSVFDATVSVKIATDFASRIDERCRRICNAPHGGTPRPDIMADLRTVPFEHSALIAYKVSDNTVQILRIFYHGQDYETILRAP